MISVSLGHFDHVFPPNLNFDFRNKGFNAVNISDDMWHTLSNGIVRFLPLVDQKLDEFMT